MKIDISNQYLTQLPVSGEYVFVRGAVGDIDVTFTVGGVNQTVVMCQGETIHMAFTALAFQAHGSDQKIDIRTGYGRYTPPMSSITAANIESIKQPVEVTGINAPVSIRNFPEVQQVAVSNLPENQAVTASFSADTAALFERPNFFRLKTYSGHGQFYVVPDGVRAEIELVGVSITRIGGGGGSLIFDDTVGNSLRKLTTVAGVDVEYVAGGLISDDKFFPEKISLIDGESIRTVGNVGDWGFNLLIKEVSL